MKLPNIGEKWVHFKGTTYIILELVWGAEGEELQLRVKYCAVCSTSYMVFSRPLTNFLETVNGSPRFAPEKIRKYENEIS